MFSDFFKPNELTNLTRSLKFLQYASKTLLNVQTGGDPDRKVCCRFLVMGLGGWVQPPTANVDITLYMGVTEHTHTL